MSDTEQRFSLITEKGMSNLRSLIGVPIVDSLEPWCHEVTRDNIRHYAHGIGDDNPLWNDPDYAAETRFGGLVAPPSFIFPLDRIISGYVGGLPGVHAMWAGADFEWHQPFRRGMEIRTEAALKDLVEHDTRFAGRSIQQIYHTDFYDKADGTLLASGDSWCFRTERDTARERGSKYDEVKARESHVYKREELDKLYELYAEEVLRGAETRYWDDVEIGDKVQPVAKGPMTVTGYIAYAQGWGGLYIRANRLAWLQLRKHPNLGIPDRFGIPDVPERVHWDPDLAKLVGTPDAYDYGPERCSWLMHHLTNWMGDDGDLVSHSSQIRRHNPVGDFIVIKGEVTDKFERDGDKLIEITQTATQQDDELSATGKGIVRLPSR